MEDAEFLSYCDGMTTTPRCGFAPEHIARLLRLAGPEHEHAAAYWASQPAQVVGGCHDEISSLAAQARARIKQAEALP